MINYLLRIVFVLFLSSVVFSQNFAYHSEDWEIITAPKSITAITEDLHFIYFASDQNIYEYDKFNNSFRHNYFLSKDFQNRTIYFFMYDQFRDFFWVLHSEGISYKSSISDNWREVSLYSVDITHPWHCQDIAVSAEYFWIKANNQFVALNPYTGTKEKILFSEFDLPIVQWGYSKYGEAGQNIDISGYVMDGQWDIRHNKIKKNNRVEDRYEVHNFISDDEIIPSLLMEDSDGNIWVGTESGTLLKSDSGSKRLKLIQFGLPFNDIYISHLDSEGSWWFAQNRFVTKNKNDDFNKNVIAQWIEQEDVWRYFSLSNDSNFKLGNVNCVARLLDDLYLGTMDGLVALDIITEKWENIDLTNLLKDPAVWDIVFYNNSIFIATAKGINEVSSINYKLIPNVENAISVFDHVQIYDMELHIDMLYVASEKGLFQLNLKDEVVSQLSEKKIKKIKVSDEYIYAMDNSLWKISIDSQNIEHIYSNIYSFAKYNDYIWMNRYSFSTLLDESNGQFWDFDDSDGILGNVIYKIGVDNEWVWFATDSGLTLFNWGRFYEF